MACNHILGEVKNPLIGHDPVTITLEDRLGAVGSLIGPEYLYFRHNLTTYQTCKVCGLDLDDIWKDIYRDAGVIGTRRLSPELFDESPKLNEHS